MDSEKLLQRCVCPVLYPIVESEELCSENNLRMSDSTNKYILKWLVKKIGPKSAQKMIRSMVIKGSIEYDPNEEFQVELILDHAREDGKDLYLVKWKGWDHVHNTWEPVDYLSCPDLIDAFHNERPILPDDDFTAVGQILNQILKPTMEVTPMQLLVASEAAKGKILSGSLGKNTRKSKRQLGANSSNPKKRRKYVQLALKEWETKLNSIITDPVGVTVENKVDLEGPPSNFEYITEYKAGNGVHLHDDPVVGCDCGTCCNGDNCCPDNAGVPCAYDRWGRLKVKPGCPIYECNKLCQCGPDCHNRVVQKGRQCKLCIFRAADGRGWGVKATQRIKKGSFVMEYLGEVITNEEAEQRGQVYDAEGMTYLFDLDYQDQENQFTIDAGFCGNISHFVNHSCDPNLVVYGVWINNLDPRLPRIAFFARRDIHRGEELTFNYTNNYEQSDDPSDDDDVIILDEAPAVCEVKDTHDAMPVSLNIDVNTPPRRRTKPIPLKHHEKNPTTQPEVINLDPITEEETADLPDKHPSPHLPVGSPVRPSPSTSLKSNHSKSPIEPSSVYVRPPPKMRRRIRCLCGAKKCKKFIF